MKVVVADDQLIFAEAAAALLVRNCHQVLGCCASSADVAVLAEASTPDVVLVGLDADGVRTEVIGEIARSGFVAIVVAMSESADAALLGQALSAGADAVFLKTEGIEELERLLSEVAASVRGAKHWSRGSSAAARRASGVAGAPTVTPREREVLSRLSRGESTSRIAAALGVGTATIRTHVQNLFYKFGTHSRLELLAQARRGGLLSSVPGLSRVPEVTGRLAASEIADLASSQPDAHGTGGTETRKGRASA